MTDVFIELLQKPRGFLGFLYLVEAQKKGFLQITGNILISLIFNLNAGN